MQRSLIPPKLELPEPGIDTVCDPQRSCNSIAIRAEDLAAQLAAREGGNMSDTINNMGSIGHSSQGMYPVSRLEQLLDVLVPPVDCISRTLEWAWGT
eukprot:762163-Hanusia_phi.AAC.7